MANNFGSINNINVIEFENKYFVVFYFTYCLSNSCKICRHNHVSSVFVDIYNISIHDTKYTSRYR